MRLRHFLPTSIAALLLAATSVASAQTAPAPPPKPTDDAGGPQQQGKTDAVTKPEDAAKRPEGWTPGLAIGATFNVTDTRNVVGVQNGTAFTLGGAIDGELFFNSGMHEWRNTLRAGAGTTHAPAIGEFVKTNDGLSLESIYLLHLIEIFGPFARAAATTQMFPSLDIRPSATEYAIANLDGTTTNLSGRRLYLTDPFAPTVLKQSIGVFVQPLQEEWMKLEGRAGLGAQEILASGNLAIADDAATTAVVEAKELDDSFQIGAEVVANAWGFIDEDKRLSYSLGLGVLVPFVTSELPAGDDRGLLDLTAIEGLAGLNLKLFDWASLNYRLTVTRQPLLVEDVQVSNMMLLTIGAAFGSKAPAPPPPEEPKCDCPPPPPPPPPPAPAPPAPAPAGPAPAPAPAPTAPAPTPAAPAPAPGTP